MQLRHTGDAPAGPRQAGHQARSHRVVVAGDDDDGRVATGRFEYLGADLVACSEDQVQAHAGELGGQGWAAFALAVGMAALNHQVLALDKTQLVQPLHEVQRVGLLEGVDEVQPADAPDAATWRLGGCMSRTRHRQCGHGQLATSEQGGTHLPRPSFKKRSTVAMNGFNEIGFVR